MKKTVRKAAATAIMAAALTAGSVFGGTSASAQSGGSFEQALSDVNSGDAWVVDITDSGVYSYYQFGYGDFFGTYTVESFTANTAMGWVTYGGSETHHWNDLGLPQNPR
jgi:hypothetical protein